MISATRLFLCGWIAVLGGGLLAHFIQTVGGSVRVQDVRFTGADGSTMSALLYVPDGVNQMRPAPGILAVHGYINSRETQSGFAIEFARRGYVVLAIDQTGHGYSTARAFANGYGGPDGLRYLRSLPFVDGNNIGLEGHSMGGGSVLAAALAFPTDYRSVVLEGSATGTLFSPSGTREFPRNLAVVFSRYDEFSRLMWGVDRASDVTQSQKLKEVFGASENIVPGRLVGSIAAGNARILYTPAVTHPGDHISRAAIGHSIEWFQNTLQGGRRLPVDDQIWYWKELGTLIALVGGLFVMLGAIGLLLRLPRYQALAASPAGAESGNHWRAWGAAIVGAALPVATYYYFLGLGARWLPASPWLPQSITNQIVLWAVLNGILLFGVAKLAQPKTRFEWRPLRPSLELAVLSAASVYIALLTTDFLFKVDFRAWVVALKLLDTARLKAFLIYLPAFVLFFVLTLHGLPAFLARFRSARAQYAAGIFMLASGFLVFLILQYVPLLVTGKLLVPRQALNAIISIQFLPLMTAIAIISVFTWRRTARILPAALSCALFVAWYVVAGTAMHVV